MNDLGRELTYYLDREPTHEEISDAEQWKMDNPGENVAIWAEDLLESEA